MHLVQTMAYANQVPWHGLGHQLTSHEPLEVWTEQAGIAITLWSSFSDYIKELTACQINLKNGRRLLGEGASYAPSSTGQPQATVNESAIRKVRALYAGKAMGLELSSANGTAWGLLNSVTEYADHRRRSRSDDQRRDAA